jgi:hypothetical protein
MLCKEKGRAPGEGTARNGVQLGGLNISENNRSPRPAQARRLVYTVPLFAGELGISTRTVWRMIAAQKIRTVAISIGRTGIPASELERIAQHGVTQ